MRDWTAETRAVLALLLLAAGSFYLWGLGTVGFQDPDEGMYAEIAREMLASGDWLVPTFNGVAYVEKPPLLYWLTAATLAALGPTEFAARLWKVLPILGSVAVTGVLGGRLFSPRVGLLGAGILATTLGAFLFSRISMMDPLLLFGISLAAYGMVCGGDRSRRGDFWFWLGIGIGMMSKGVPGLAFPLALLAWWALVQWDAGAVRALCTGRGILVAAVLVLPWHIMVSREVPGFLRFYVVDNQVLRFLGARAYVEDGTSLGTLAFLGVTAVALFPWTPVLAAALDAAGRGRARDPGLRFLLGWAALVVGLFLASSFKLEYYALPAFPAAALLAAALVCRAAASATDSAEGSALRRWVWMALVGGALFCLAVARLWQAGYFSPANIVRGLAFWSTNYRIILDHGLPLPPVSPGWYAAVLLGGGALWTAGFGAAACCLSRRRVWPAAAAIGAVGVGMCLLAGVVLREVGPHHSLKPLADRLNGLLRPGDVLIHERGMEKGGGLLFYTKRRALILNGRQGDLEFGSGLPGESPTFIGSEQFRELWAGSGRAFLVTDLPLQRSAIGRIAGGAPALLASTGTRWLYANRKAP